MRAKQFIRRINEGADESSVITSEVIKLISDGHTEVSPDVITAKVSAALGRPFMLKDLVSANNSSPELQHYIDSINPSKIKFSTDILTVKNQDPTKDKERAEAGVASMASRAASRPRLGESTEGVKYGVYRRGGSLGSRGGLIKTFDTKEEAQEYAKRQRRHLTPGERSYYKMGYNVKAVKDEEVNEGWSSGGDRVSLPDEPSTYWAGNGALQDEYNRLYDELVPSQGKADTIEGEVLRAASKIVYRHYNDGDEFNQASFDQLEPYIGTVASYDDLAHKAAEFAVKANGNYTPNPNWDSLDLMDYGPVDDDDDYEEDDDYDDWSDDVDNEEEDDEDLAEGWESGPEERAPRERDPDAEYDDMRQQRADAEAERQQARRPQEKYYTLTGRGPNMEPNYAFPGQFDSLEAAVAARKELMADPKTPNPRDIGISTHTRYLDEGRDTPLRDLEDYQAKKKALQDIQTDPNTSKDADLSTEVIRRLAGLERQRKDLK